MKKLTSVSLMLIFTVSGFLVLAVSIVLLTAELLVSTVLSETRVLEKGSLKERVARVKELSEESQVC